MANRSLKPKPFKASMWGESGSFADLTSKPINRVRGHCVRCGTGIDKKKKYCLPCASDAYDEKRTARRERYKANSSPPPKDGG